MTPIIGRTLSIFHHNVACRLAGIKSKRDTKWRREYPPLDVAIEAVGLEEVVKYVLFRQNTTSQYIMNLLILEICLAEERRPEAWVIQRWWDQGDLNLGLGEGRTADRAVEAGREAGAEMEAEKGNGELE